VLSTMPPNEEGSRLQHAALDGMSLTQCSRWGGSCGHRHHVRASCADGHATKELGTGCSIIREGLQAFRERSIPVPALPSSIIEPIWDQVSDLLPVPDDVLTTS
jgi:hypothetical protein